MGKFYSPSAGGFYCEDVHGLRVIERSKANPLNLKEVERWTEPNPKCLIPADAVEITPAQHAALMAAQAAGKLIRPGPGGVPVAVDPPPPSDAAVIARLTAVVQQHLDDAAKALGYDDMRSAVTYADEPAVPKFQAEGLALRAWRSLVWEHCFAVLAAVKAGSRATPTAAQLVAELPTLTLT